MSAIPILLRGDCLTELRRIPDASVHAVVTDPPYGIDFMGKDWDSGVRLANGMVGQMATGDERVGAFAKGGSHSRGYANHNGLAFEEWTTRWAAECLRILRPGGHLLAFGGTRTWHRLAAGIEDAGFEIRDSFAWLYGSGMPKGMDVSKAIDKTAGIWRGRAGSKISGNDSMSGSNYKRTPKGSPATESARQWDGWGTAVKPAFEPVVVARKPLRGTVAANVIEHGTGALNIDGTRIPTSDELSAAGGTRVMDNDVYGKGLGVSSGRSAELGARWPSNVLLDEIAAAALDEQATGNPSRFFYIAKASKSERVAVDGIAHPTVKPLALMRYLCRLVTPPSGVVVDPFAGSGTTLEAAYLEGFESIGVELTPEYWPLIEARIARATAVPLIDGLC